MSQIDERRVKRLINKVTSRINSIADMVRDCGKDEEYLRDSFEALKLDIKTLESVSRKLLALPHRDLDALRDQMFDIQINTQEYVDLYFERLKGGFISFDKFKVVFNLSVKRNTKKAPPSTIKKTRVRNASPNFGRVTEVEKDNQNARNEKNGESSGFDMDESAGLVDLLDQLKVKPELDKIDRLLQKERAMVSSSKNFTEKASPVRESSDFFDDFEDFSARKSAISSVSGISRKPIGLDEFEDFGGSSIDDQEQFQDHSLSDDQEKIKSPKFPKFDNINPALSDSGGDNSNKYYQETGRGRVESNATINFSSGSSEAMMQENLDIESEDEQKIYPGDESKQQGSHQLTLDLSFADKNPYFSVQEDSKQFRKTLTDKWNPETTKNQKVSRNLFTPSKQPMKGSTSKRFGEEKYFEAEDSKKLSKNGSLNGKSKQELVQQLHKQEAEIKKYKNSYKSLLEKWREEMENESNFESRRMSMMKESLSRSRGQSLQVDIERRNSCRSLIGGYEGFKKIKQNNFRAPPTPKAPKVKKEYNFSSTTRPNDNNKVNYPYSASKYKLDTSKFSLSMRNFTSKYKDKPSSSSTIKNYKNFSLETYKSFDVAHGSRNTDYFPNSVKTHRKIDRFMKDFDAAKSRISSSTSNFMQEWNQRKKELGLDHLIKTASRQKEDPLSQTLNKSNLSSSKKYTSDRMGRSMTLNLPPKQQKAATNTQTKNDYQSRRVRESSRANNRKYYSLDQKKNTSLNFSLNTRTNLQQPVYKSKYLNETLGLRESVAKTQPKYGQLNSSYMKYAIGSVSKVDPENAYFNNSNFKSQFQKKSPSSYIDKYLNRIKVEKNLFEESHQQKKISEFPHENRNYKPIGSLGDRMYSGSGISNAQQATMKVYKNLNLNLNLKLDKSNLGKQLTSSKLNSTTNPITKYQFSNHQFGNFRSAYKGQDTPSKLNSNMRRSGYKVMRVSHRNSTISNYQQFR